MKKKLVTMLLLASMLAASLASCAADDGGSTADTSAASNDTTAADTTVADTQAEYVAPEEKFDGEEFTFAAWESLNPSWIATTYCEVGAKEMNGDLINDAIYERNATVEEQFGITIVEKGFQSSSDFVKTAMAGDSYADAALLEGGVIKDFLNNDLLTDLLTVDTLDTTKSWWNQNAKEAFTIGGRLYFLPGNIGSFDNLSVYSVFFNKNMVESFSLDDPYEAVRSGSWTYEMMEKHATTVASDLDGDGKMTAADRFGMSSESALASPMLRAAGIHLTEMNADGYPELTLNNERAASVLEKVVPLSRNKDITLFAGDFSSQYDQVFSDFMVPQFIADKLLYVNNWLSIALEMRNMASDFGILPPPKFDETQDSYYVASSESWTLNAVIPVTNNRLEITGYVFDALGYYGQQLVQTALIDTTITDKALRDTDTEEMLGIIFANRTFDIATIFDWGGLYATLSSMISSNSTNFASVMATNESMIVKAMEETIDALS